jgi:uncharacterized SAM-binding protein YcdF (DUF218 family)
MKKLLGASAAVIALAFVFRVPALQLSAQPLIASDNDRLRKADAILILGGGLDSRPFEAARLFHLGLAPTLLVSNEEPDTAAELGLERSRCEITIDLLTRIEKVPHENIVLMGSDGSIRSSETTPLRTSKANSPPGSSACSELGYLTSTFDEAKAVRKWCEANKAHSIIIVTNPFHSRRARWIFNKVLEQPADDRERRLKVSVQVGTVDSKKYDPLDWWQSEEGMIAFNNEWVKTFYYFFKY